MTLETIINYAAGFLEPRGLHLRKAHRFRGSSRVDPRSAKSAASSDAATGSDRAPQSQSAPPSPNSAALLSLLTVSTPLQTQVVANEPDWIGPPFHPTTNQPSHNQSQTTHARLVSQTPEFCTQHHRESLILCFFRHAGSRARTTWALRCTSAPPRETLRLSDISQG